MKPFQAKTPNRHSPFQIIYGSEWRENDDGQSINRELLERVRALASFLIDHDLVTSHIVFNEGVRSRQRAHKMSTSFFLCEEPSKIPLVNLRALPGGRDLDGNQWYDPAWNSILRDVHGLPPDSLTDLRHMQQDNLRDVWSRIRERARQIKRQDALAAEGYPINDPHVLPNVHSTISNHVGGNAIDCHIEWKLGAVVLKYQDDMLEKPPHNPWLMQNDRPIGQLMIMDGGLNDVAANDVIDHFGLCRPVTGKHAEIWHYQLSPHRRPLGVKIRQWRH